MKAILGLLLVLGLSQSAIAEDVQAIPRRTPTNDTEVISSRVCPLLNQGYTTGETIKAISDMMIANIQGNLADKLSRPDYTNPDLERYTAQSAKLTIITEVSLYCRQHLPLIDPLVQELKKQ